MTAQTTTRTDSDMFVGLADVEAAAQRIVQFVRPTPVLSNVQLDTLAGCQLSFKCENLQTGGAFKIRGAANAVLCLDELALKTGVATHSSGNHAAALSLVAQRLNIPASVVMPENASRAKVEAVRSYGGQISFCAPTIAARESCLAAICERTGARSVPPFDDVKIIAGQGTCALELVEQIEPAPDFLVVPVGGGGLISGCGIVCEALWKHCRVVGAEPAGAAYAAKSMATGTLQPQVAPQTIADGLRAALGKANFPIVQRTVDTIYTVDDHAIVQAMRLLWTHLKLVIEPSAAVGLAAVLANPDVFARKHICIVLSGGNVDIDALPWV